MTRSRKIRRFTPLKNPFVFKDRLFGFANFSKFILGRNEENQKLAAEKIWIRVFPEFGRLLEGYGSTDWRPS